MGRVMDLIGACVTVAWWDGSCLGLRLHRLGDLIDHVAAGSRFEERRTVTASMAGDAGTGLGPRTASATCRGHRPRNAL